MLRLRLLASLLFVVFTHVATSMPLAKLGATGDGDNAPPSTDPALPASDAGNGNPDGAAVPTDDDAAQNTDEAPGAPPPAADPNTVPRLKEELTTEPTSTIAYNPATGTEKTYFKGGFEMTRETRPEMKGGQNKAEAEYADSANESISGFMGTYAEQNNQAYNGRGALKGPFRAPVVDTQTLKKAVNLVDEGVSLQAKTNNFLDDNPIPTEETDTTI